MRMRLLDVFHWRTQATAICSKMYPRGGSACLIVPSSAQRNTVFWPIYRFLVFPGHRLIFYRFTPSSADSIPRRTWEQNAASDAGLGAIRADAETAAARKVGDHDRAGRHETLAASYRALRDHY